jgi:hypothetical protein
VPARYSYGGVRSMSIHSAGATVEWIVRIKLPGNGMPGLNEIKKATLSNQPSRARRPRSGSLSLKPSCQWRRSLGHRVRLPAPRCMPGRLSVNTVPGGCKLAQASYHCRPCRGHAFAELGDNQ